LNVLANWIRSAILGRSLLALYLLRRFDLEG